MERATFPGIYRDALGQEPVLWAFEPVATEPAPTFALTVTVRGVVLDATQLDIVEAEIKDRARAEAAGLALAPGLNQLSGCSLEGRVPVAIQVGGQRHTAQAVFTLDFPIGETVRLPGEFLPMSIEANGAVHESTGDSFEHCLEEIDRSLRPEARLVSCLTCRWSDSQQYTAAAVGMKCNRRVREEHLAAQASGNKHRMNNVGPTEWVPESHLCPEFEFKKP